jgi:chemotaxis protein MotB
MKQLLFLVTLLIALGSCVPIKKYNELLAKEQSCSEELEKYKNNSLDFEAKLKDVQASLNVSKDKIAQLVKDTTNLGQQIRELKSQKNKLSGENEALNKELDKLRDKGAKLTASMQAELDAKNIELQRKEDALLALEAELKTKGQLLAEREQRVNELEELLKRKDEAAELLRNKIANALKGFENQGLSVVEKDGKIYVSMEAKLLFASGSTLVEANGKKALIELAKVLELEKDIEIIVEGHTDTDKLSSAVHPKSNWELSVLRATSVVDILIINSKINPSQLMAAGRSEYHPVDPADKAKNRRIEIILAPNLNELYELINQK